MIDEFIEKGYTHFIILGKSEVGDLVSLSLSRCKKKSIVWGVWSEPEENISQLKSLPKNILILDCSYHGQYGYLGIAVIEKLLTHGPKELIPLDYEETDMARSPSQETLPIRSININRASSIV